MNNNDEDYSKFDEVIKALRPIDDVMFKELIRDDIKIVELCLKIILDKDDLIVEDFISQYDLSKTSKARNLILDVKAKDSKGISYNIEVQKDNSGADIKKARYHLSAIDVENSYPGMKFKDMVDNYVIFITEEDYFLKGLTTYHIERVNLELQEKVNDGSYIIYVNGKYRGDDDIGKLMHDFNCKDPQDMYIPIISTKISQIKYNKDKENKTMCEELEKLLKKERENAQFEGETKEAKKNASRLYEKGNSIEDIADVLQRPVSQVSLWLENN